MSLLRPLRTPDDGTTPAGSRTPLLKLLPFLFTLFLYLSLPIGLSRGWGDTNILSRLYLTHALSERGSVNITQESIRFQSIDDAVILNNRFYSNKAPGSSFWLWAVSKPMAMLAGAGPALSIADLAFFGRIAALLLPFLFFLVSFGRHLERRTGDARAAWLAVGALAVGTNAGVYLMGYYGHVLAAMLLAWAWMRTADRSTAGTSTPVKGCFAEGFLLASAVAVEYNAAPIAAIIALRTALSCPRGSRGYAAFTFAAGLLPPAFALGAYHQGITGHFWMPPFHFDMVWRTYYPEQTRLIFGLTTPSLQDFLDQWASPSRGMLFYSPWLIFVFIGAALILARALVRAAAARSTRSVAEPLPPTARRFVLPDLGWSLSIIAVYAVIMSCYIGWRVGFSTGMRLFILILPFAAVITAHVLAALPKGPVGSAARTLWTALVTLSVGIFAALATSFPVHAAPEHQFGYNVITGITLRAWETGRTAMIWPHLFGLGFKPGICLMLSLPLAAWALLVAGIEISLTQGRAPRRMTALLRWALIAVLTAAMGWGWLAVGRDPGRSMADAAAYWTPFLHSPSADPGFDPFRTGKWSRPHDKGSRTEAVSRLGITLTY